MDNGRRSTIVGPFTDCRLAIIVNGAIYFAQRYIDDKDTWVSRDFEMEDADEKELAHLIKYGCNRYFVADTRSMFLPYDQRLLEIT